jgi:hypothetical protein
MIDARPPHVVYIDNLAEEIAQVEAEEREMERRKLEDDETSILLVPESVRKALRNVDTLNWYRLRVWHIMCYNYLSIPSHIPEKPTESALVLWTPKSLVLPVPQSDVAAMDIEE